jgi:hypothetical protein
MAGVQAFRDACVADPREVAGWWLLRLDSAMGRNRGRAVAVLASIRRFYPWLRHIFANGGQADAWCYADVSA